ncbi:MAG: GvpL/GvpF family gas vesicle protein [Candidatus Contendobacter sp.]|nr:GvpL/GvpF family gas vesicle protein [Candidatus Contendobacter sp.]
MAGTGKGCYIYAIAAAGEDGKIYDFTGIGGGAVYAIAAGGAAMIVSDIALTRIRPERRNIAAHQDVLRRLMADSTVLPITFGTIAERPAAVRTLLARYQKVLVDQLHRVAGKVEMGIRVSWDVPNIFEYMVITHEELRALRDQLLGDGHQPTREEKIELGQAFERLLNAERETYAGSIEELLTPVCVEIRCNPPRQESEIMNLACLIERDRRTEFEQAVEAASQQFDDHFLFNYNGPWAPHNFVKVDLSFNRR